MARNGSNRKRADDPLSDFSVYFETCGFTLGNRVEKLELLKPRRVGGKLSVRVVFGQLRNGTAGFIASRFGRNFLSIQRIDKLVKRTDFVPRVHFNNLCHLRELQFFRHVQFVTRDTELKMTVRKAESVFCAQWKRAF